MKIEEAFSAGYDPALELSKQHTRRPSDDFDDEFPEDVGPWTSELRRKEQGFVDDVIQGREPGHYFMLLGPKVRILVNLQFVGLWLILSKGSGKGTLIFQSMTDCQAEGVSLCDAHPDLEVFRLRLGKALNFEFYEDSQTGLFQRRDPREGEQAQEHLSTRAYLQILSQEDLVLTLREVMAPLVYAQSPY